MHLVEPLLSKIAPRLSMWSAENNLKNIGKHWTGGWVLKSQEKRCFLSLWLILNKSQIVQSRARLVSTLWRVEHRLHHVRALPRIHTLPNAWQSGTSGYDGKNTRTSSWQVWWHIYISGWSYEMMRSSKSLYLKCLRLMTLQIMVVRKILELVLTLKGIKRDSKLIIKLRISKPMTLNMILMGTNSKHIFPLKQRMSWAKVFM